MRNMLFTASVVILCAGMLAPHPVTATDLTEYEPNNTVATANPIVVGDIYLAAIGAMSDVDWFRFDTAGGAAAFTTEDGANLSPDDTVMALYAADGTTRLALDSGYPWHCYLARYFAPGTYYVKVSRGTYGQFTGNYVLTCTGGSPPHANDLCTGAIDVQGQGLQSWTLDLSANGGYYADYMPPQVESSCLPVPPTGPDAVYAVSLAANESIIISETGDCDVSLWIATDCGNLNGSCVAGADAVGGGATETVTYAAPMAGVYFIVVDSYDPAGCPAVVSIGSPVAIEGATFGTLKAMYR